MSETVVLSKNVEPKYPDCCVVCRQKGNIKWLSIRGEAVGFYGFVKWIAGKSGKRKVPLHVECATKLRRRRFWRNVEVLILATALPAAWVAMELSEDQMPFEFNKETLVITVIMRIKSRNKEAKRRKRVCRNNELISRLLNELLMRLDSRFFH